MLWEGFKSIKDSGFSYSRTPKDQNMLIVIIEDVEISEDVYFEATKLFVSQEVRLFNDRLIGVSLIYMVLLIIFALGLSHKVLISPIKTLTKRIVNPS